MTHTRGIASPPGIPATQRLSFLARRNGTRLGTHNVTFRRDGDRLGVDIAVDYTVKLTFITAYRYRLRATEQWEQGVLTSMRARTDNNGKAEFMRADRIDGALIVEGSGTARYHAPPGAMLCSHWNPAQLDGPMINPQDGTLLNFTISAKGPARVADTAGRTREAQRFSLEGAHSLDLWYDTQGIWTALQGAAEDGSVIIYQPVF